MTNLLDETIDILKEHDKTFEDIMFIQGYDFKITKENFEQVAKKTNYDSGLGAAHVATDLVVVGKNWWLERGEYDGSEWWKYKESPKQVNEVREISHLAGGLWPTLKKLNSPKNPMQERVEKLRKEEVEMTKTIEIPDWCSMWDSESERYGSLEELKELLLYKRIVKWDKDFLELEDGTKVTIEESESDCCARAGGEFKNVQLDAVITDVKIGAPTKFDNGDGTTCENTVTIYHNQNIIALAECDANDGNGGYYYSVGSLVIGKIHFPVVEA